MYAESNIELEACETTKKTKQNKTKRQSAVGNKRISQFFDSAREPRSPVIALVDSTWVFLLLSFYIVISWNMPLFKVWSEDKLNKKFVEAENFLKCVSKGKRFCLYLFVS